MSDRVIIYAVCGFAIYASLASFGTPLDACFSTVMGYLIADMLD